MLSWAKNGQEAFDLVKDNCTGNKCIVLMDIKMPVMDGVEANKMIKKFNKEIPVIAVTAHAQVGDKSKLLKQDFDDYIAKPISSQELMKLLSFYYSKLL